ncbi:MAG: RlpA-like double-psi beta-barrel domain-containing protein [Actinomycetota bacterium]
MALWALLGALFTLAVAAASAHATAGGTSTGGASTIGDAARFGTRELSVGMEGNDVKVLNGIVKSKSYASGVRLSTVFEGPTEGAVKQFQSEAGLGSTGVVDKTTSRALRASMSKAGATWYGPGFYGNSTACGKTLRRDTIGVAHKSLPCGTKVTFAYHGRSIVAPVIDRGPYAKGYSFDLTGATAKAIGFTNSDTIRYAVARAGSDRRAP